jgi:hypothetical protein
MTKKPFTAMLEEMASVNTSSAGASESTYRLP